jgi:hypothetical protein
MRAHRARHLRRAHQQIWGNLCRETALGRDIVASQEKHRSLMKHWAAAERYGPWHCSK